MRFEMVDLVRNGEADKFVCAAGVLTHYVGDACQPLHISYLHDGDPNRPFTHTYQRGNKAGTSEQRPLGQGVHSAYEDAMVRDHRKESRWIEEYAKGAKVGMARQWIRSRCPMQVGCYKHFDSANCEPKYMRVGETGRLLNGP